MRSLTRRTFLEQSSMSLGSLLVLKGLPSFINTGNNNPGTNPPIGFQVYPVRDMLVKDFAGTLKTMAGMGYQTLEMCSPAGYISSGFEPLVKMKPAEMKKIFSDLNLSCESCHFTMGEFRTNLDERIAFAKELGLKYMVASSFWLNDKSTLDDYLKCCDELNKMAEKTAAAGMQMGFHNHDMEFHQLDGQLIYDALLKRLDPKLVKMQFQTEVITLGYKAADYFKKYPGRFMSSHLSDWTADKKEAPIGKGVIDWKEYFEAAKTGGVKNYYVEMDFDTYKDSSAYLHQLLKA
ncbi:MAG: sugar phosphate isomerase/epimerase [Chitinophagaceae bacterium]|nr:sugar phosphate isomerase/epimerase [Chitinophagaceae bacterium]